MFPRRFALARESDFRKAVGLSGQDHALPGAATTIG
jgi:hypothetical protein